MYQIALIYGKLKTNSTTFTLIRLNNKMVVIKWDKKTLIKIYIFLFLSIFHKNEYIPEKKTAHAFITRDKIGKVLLY